VTLMQDGYREADDDEFGISPEEWRVIAVGCGLLLWGGLALCGAGRALYGALRRIL